MSDSKDNDKTSVDDIIKIASSPDGFKDSNLVKSTSASQIIQEGVDLTFTYHNDGKESDSSNSKR